MHSVFMSYEVLLLIESSICDVLAQKMKGLLLLQPAYYYYYSPYTADKQTNCEEDTYIYKYK